MSRHRAVLLAITPALWATGVAAQAHAAMATLVAPISAVVELSVGRGASSQVRLAGYTEVRQAVVLKIDASCGWRLVAKSADSGTLPVMLRVSSSDGRAMTESVDFRAVSNGGQKIASGGHGGSIELLVDYRIPDGTAVLPISYEVQAGGE